MPSMPTKRILQAAVIALRNDRVCLVRSRNGRRWVIPKGLLEPDKSSDQIALQEAWEEAGLIGILGDRLGTFEYEKYGGICLVEVFRLDVTRIDDDWPEKAWRRPTWVSVEKAITLVNEPGLKSILGRLVAALRERD